VKEEDSNTRESPCFALFKHPDRSTEWKECTVLRKLDDDKFRIKFWHDENQSFVVKRKDVLLSMDYKRAQESFYQEEIHEFLEKLDKEEAQIAEIFRQHDERGMRHEGLEAVKKNLAEAEFEGLRIQEGDMQEEEDEYVEESYYENA